LTGFVFVSIFRALAGEERPYEKYNFEPVIPKDTKKHSFPSRHVFSAAVIAGTWIVFFPAVGAGLIAITALIAILRVICGLHYIHDVVAGGLMGLAWGVFGTIIMI
jgi:membrane-associated phospholipid phosphatase